MEITTGVFDNPTIMGCSDVVWIEYGTDRSTYLLSIVRMGVELACTAWNPLTGDGTMAVATRTNPNTHRFDR